MRVAGKLILFSIFLLACHACFEPPRFSVVPSIDTPLLKFADVTDPALDDSLTLTINFKDGDGDLGLGSGADFNPPYNLQDYFDLQGQAFDFGVNAPTKYFYNSLRGLSPSSTTNDTLITFSLKRTAAKYDTIPDFVPPFDCSSYAVVDSANVVKTSTGTSYLTDTLYTYLNPNYYNIFVDVYVYNQSTKVFEKFDFNVQFQSPNCAPYGFNGRFPVLSSDTGKPAPLEGKIQYGMTSTGWRTFFDKQLLQLHIQIEDRALHKSNVLLSNPFTLDDIK